MSKRVKFLAMFSMFIVMLGMSFVGGSRGVLVPALKNDFSISDGTMGMIFLISTLGYMIFTYIAGNILEKIGSKKTLIIGTLVVITSLFLMVISPNYIIFALAYFINGAGNAFLIFGVNFTTPLFMVAFQAALLNIIHGSYGMGSAFIQKLTGFLLTNNIGWRQMIIGIMIFQVFVLFIIMISKYPSIPKVSKVDARGAPVVFASPFKDKLIYLYIFTLGFGLFGEHGINNWFVNYMKEGFGVSENIGSTYLSIFFVLFTIGRFAGGFLLEKLGYIKGVIYAQLITILIYTIAILLGENGFVLFPIAGVFQAIIYPTIILTIPKVFSKNSAQAMSIIVIGASLINNLGSYVLGVLNDTIGVTKAFYMLPIQLTISAIAAFLIYQNNKKKLEEAPSGK